MEKYFKKDFSNEGWDLHPLKSAILPGRAGAGIKDPGGKKELSK